MDPQTANKKQKSRERRLRLLLLLGSILFSLAIIEIGLRLAGYSYSEFYAIDGQRGYALRPGMEGWYRKEGEALVRINSDGMRDREHLKQKAPNTLRIAVLGDSYTEAFQVPFEEGFCAVLEQKLRECALLPGKNVEVLNFGVSGYGTAQELITLRDHVWEYSPDIVLLAVTTNNDISDNVRALKKTNEVPYFVWHDGKLEEDDSFLQTKNFRLQKSFLGSLGRWFRDHLRLVQAIDQGHYGLKIYLAARKAKTAQTPQTRDSLVFESQDQKPNHSTSSSPADQKLMKPRDGVALADELGVDNVIYREPADPVWDDAWRVTLGLIGLMRAEVQSNGAKFMVVTLSNGIQVWPDPAAREAYLKRIGATDIFYPDNRLREFCEHENIPVITLAPSMQQYADKNKVFLHGFGQQIGNGHWNRDGHRLAAELTAQGVCDLLKKDR